MTLSEFLAVRLDEKAEMVHACFQWVAPRFMGVENIALRKLFEQMLREVEAKRKILADHRDDAELLPGACYRCRCGVPAHWESVAWPCPTLRALAAVYSDHPDYDEAWRPEP